MTKNPYEVLGVSPNASEEEIKKVLFMVLRLMNLTGSGRE